MSHSMRIVRLFGLALGLMGLIVLGAGLALGEADFWRPAAVAAAIGVATGLAVIPPLRVYQFTAWIVAAVATAMIYPANVLQVGPVELSNPWLLMLAIQAVMFGMGTQMSLSDFAGVARMPQGVVVGIVCQFTIMPLVGAGLAVVFAFPPEIAAGLILVGSCSSGLASNVMVFMARGNLALSITLTAVATSLAPLLTPLWMKALAGTLVEVSFFALMRDIVQLVIVPIAAALLHDYLKRASLGGRRLVLATAAVGVAWLAYVSLGGWQWLVSHTAPYALPHLGLAGFLFGAVIAGVVYHWLVLRWPAVQRAMPWLAMMGIIYVVAVITAAGRDELLLVGGWLFLAVVVHNAAGFGLGYWLSRALGLDASSARTVAIEVGMQNGGMAAGLAQALGKMSTVGLAAVLFASWMNVTGSLLANYWRRRPVLAAEAVVEDRGP